MVSNSVLCVLQHHLGGRDRLIKAAVAIENSGEFYLLYPAIEVESNVIVIN